MRLILLGVLSFFVANAFGFVFPFIYMDSEARPSVYPWTYGLIFSGLTVVIFLLCLDDPNQRRAACAAFGISALLAGPSYVWNAERLAEFAPTSSPWAAPHLPVVLSLLCWGLSAALLIWWLKRTGSIPRQGMMQGLLFFGLLLILLVVPWVTNRCGIESMRILTALPTSADDHRQSSDTLTQFLVQWEASAVGDVCGFIVQTLGMTVTALTLIFMIVISAMGRVKSEIRETRLRPFPNRGDWLPLLFLVVGGLLYPLTVSCMSGLAQQFADVERSMGRHVYPYEAGIESVEVMAGMVFWMGLWIVLYRIRTAPQLRFGFTLLVLIASAGLSVWSTLYVYQAMKLVGVLGLILFLAQVFFFFDAKRRAVWTSSAFASPGQTALSFTLQGSIVLAILASALFAVAIELAYISVFGIHYFIAWGTALKPLHGVAPTEKIALGIVPNLASIQIVMGPVYFSACLFVTIMVAVLFFLIYWGCQGCAKLYRRVNQFPTKSTQVGFPISAD